MSIALLTQVYSEARRLAIAGSVVAHGDFRLKKLLPPLEQAGKQAPVFAKVADAAKAVVEGPESESAVSLLELTSLVSAVLYTQGETGLAGKLEPVETTDLGGSVVQTSARVLKPLLEALSSTGSGRLELIRDAHDRGLFRDLRLVKPALAALDDPYSEIADLIAIKVLPKFGKAIAPELRANYDPKGTKGHPRRLKLLHTIDPEGTRELVKSALEEGSKDVKVAAIACLGADPEDLAFLTEQTAAKAQDVRQAAYQALAKVDHPDSVALLAKALTGKDCHLAADAIENSRSPKLVEVLVAEVQSGVDGLPKLKDKKKIGEAIQRLMHLLNSIPAGDFPAAENLLLDLFARRKDLAKIKGENWSGADLSESAIRTMSRGTKKLRDTLVAAHAELEADQLQMAVFAGRSALSSTEFYETFAPYLAATTDKQKKAKREAVISGVTSGSRYYWWHLDIDDPIEDDDEDDDDSLKFAPLDPRWLDRALALKESNLVYALARPGHDGALQYVKSEFDAALKKAKAPHDLQIPLYALVKLRHPDTTEAFFAAMAKRGKKAQYYSYYWLTGLVPRLSKDAIPRLEEMIAGMPDHEANHWVDAIQELRTRA